ncbi:MAG: hypothetical protein P8M25_00680, partial [Paracoccaceae bacterium]|nr:hypothetical protein [Paracoccaceae bacterium]
MADFPPLCALPHVLVRRDVSRMYPSDRPEFCRGGLVLYATLADYMRFGLLLLTGRRLGGDKILAPKTYALLKQSRLTADQMPCWRRSLGINLAGLVLPRHFSGLIQALILLVLSCYYFWAVICRWPQICRLWPIKAYNLARGTAVRQRAHNWQATKARL